MIFIRVRYDAYNRRFKLLDRDLARILEDGRTYSLAIDTSAAEHDTEEFIPGDTQENLFCVI